jgi:2,3-bisphosphoglycerate-dependent phosphoglycerate mutase
MSEILLLRHGETLWNVEGRIQGHRDSPLSAEGIAQAEALARRLAAERPDVLYTSDLGRARQTMEPIARVTGLAPRIDPGLRERCYGAFEGRTWPEIERDFPEQYASHLTGSATVRADGGESMMEFRDRAVGALERIAEASGDGKVVIVAHGGVLGLLYRHIMNIPLEAARKYAMPNASINRFTFKSGIWCLIAWGDLSHLDHALPEEFADSVDSRFR